MYAQEFSRKARLLVLDDEPDFIDRLTRLLGGEYEIDAVGTWDAGRKVLERKAVDVLIIDFQLGSREKDGLEIIRKLKKEGPISLGIILISKFMDRRLQESGRQNGADNCMDKAMSDGEMKREISNVIARNMEMRKLMAMVREDREKSISPVFESKPMHALLDALLPYIKSSENILITGEKGTGKSEMAKWIHRKSDRSDGVFQQVYIPALEPGLMNSELFGHMKGAFPGADRDMPGVIEVCNGGSLLLDEIGELNFESQARFLGVLQDRRFRRVTGSKDISFDVRFISVTNRPDLDRDVVEGRFRGDLLDRLRQCHIHMPPLRERREDIPRLAADILDRKKREHNRPDLEGFDEALMERMLEYPWPGNIRELDGWIHSGALNAYGVRVKLSDVERSRSINAKTGSDGQFDSGWYSRSLRDATREAQRMLIEHVLSRMGGNVADAADKLGVSRMSLYRYCDKLGIDRGKKKE